MNCTPSGVSTVQFAVEVTRYDMGLCFKIFNFSISSILMTVFLEKKEINKLTFIYVLYVLLLVCDDQNSSNSST